MECKRSRNVYLYRKPVRYLRHIPIIRSLRLAQHWGFQVGEDGDIWELERPNKYQINAQKSGLAKWKDADRKWPKELIGTTNSTDSEIASVVFDSISRMHGDRPQNDPSSLEDWEYSVVSKMLHKVFHLGDYSIGQNNCQDLVIAVAKALCGRSVNMGTIFKPKTARMFARNQVRASKQAGLRHHRTVNHTQHVTRVSRHHHHQGPRH